MEFTFVNIFILFSTGIVYKNIIINFKILIYCKPYYYGYFNKL